MRASEFARRVARIDSDKGLKFRPHGRGYRRKAIRALLKRSGAALIVPNGRFVGYRMKDGSVVCVKQRFHTRASAEVELARIGRHASHDYVPVRAYCCEWCGGWHLTSRA